MKGFDTWQKEVGQYLSYKKLGSLKALETFAYSLWKTGFAEGRKLANQAFKGSKDENNIPKRS